MKSQVMKIGIYARQIDHFIETVASLLAWDGRFQVTLVISGEPFPQTEHFWSVRRLAGAGRVRIIDWHGEPEQWDALWLYLPTIPKEERKRMRRWASRAGEIGLLSPELYDVTWKRHLKEAIKSVRYLARARRALVQAASSSIHPYLPLRHTGFYAIYVHPQFFNQPELLATFREVVQKRKDSRRYTFAFIGNRQPESRERALQAMRREFAEKEYDLQESTDRLPRSDSLAVLWIEYGPEGAVRGLKPDDFLATLEEVEFCFCPFGWSRFSHRVVEALAAGSIPILEGEASYNRGLRDGVNCLVVENGDWVKTVRRAQAMPAAQRQEIRENVYKLRAAQLTPELAALDCVRRLGW